ncbi:MAG: class I SAM-dependent methyltransferase [Clostridia bacterium]|nr:class I SAM-dependent methyltransferase [Clostridia bacterium]
MKPLNLEEIHKSFNTQAPCFESEKFHLSRQEYPNYIVEKTAPQKTDTVLEAAAGTGVCGRSFSPYVRHITCLDATSAMLEIGKKECEKEGIGNITFIKGYAEDLPFLDKSFDIVISRLAFHHFTDADGIFKEMERVLKPNGKLVLVDMISDDETLRNEVDRIEKIRDFSHVRNLSLSEMHNLYTKNNLTLEFQEQTDIPVSLEAWMELTETPKESREEIRNLMSADLDKKYITGFFPYLKDNDIYFKQHWILNIGKKQKN